MSDYNPVPLNDLIYKAESEGKWLRADYQGITFTPQELREENKNGKFRWGPCNWSLIDPKTLLKDVDAITSKAEEYNKDISKRIIEALNGEKARNKNNT